jgi:hypothetical protein
VSAPLPRGVSALIDPDDELYLRILELCARTRRRLGLPSLDRSELAALLDRRAQAGRAADLPRNVLPFRRHYSRRR